ncbi:MAG: hypothetical protein ACK4VY_06465 [Brevundimonas sp.]
MSYGADFATADPANAPLDPTILIGAEPAFWAGVLLALLAAAALGWFFGSRSHAGRPDAAHDIWKAIHDATRSAMGADDNALKGRAEALRKVIRERLGKTLILADGLCERITTLDDAIAGRSSSHSGGGHAHDHGHGPSGGGHGPTHGPAKGHGHGDHGSDSGHGEPAPTGGGGGGGGAATANITIVTGCLPEKTPAKVSATDDHGAHDDHHAPREMTRREQTDALRLAVAAFNEHWRDESARVGELRAAHAELSHPGPAGTRGGRAGAGRANH